MKNKNIVNQAGNQNTQFNKNKPSPEIRDNLDSRKNEEQDNKGDDVTHNEKQVRSDNKQRKRNGSR